VSETSWISRRAPSSKAISTANADSRAWQRPRQLRVVLPSRLSLAQAENFLARKACQYLGSRVWCFHHG